ncbi:MAG: CRTAC1 family protein [Abditibacteriales bacterium]|nr:CRTAC1 family protein [Abditibacteriales bacterium]MDW8366677.1 CRTAC1 family protein [Abditibacteriales bacterium]
MKKLAFLPLLFILFAAGCQPSQKVVSATPVRVEPTATIAFTDVTAQAGIRFMHVHGGFGPKWLPETMGSGCAFIDYDNDGWQDIFLVNSSEWPEEFLKMAGVRRQRQKVTSRLYRNKGDGTFEDVTERAGLAVETYGMGCCVADYDNDGDDDIYLTALGRNYLFRNEGNGTFKDVAESAGVKDKGWSTSCAFLDYDRDGKLDLFVGHYVVWNSPKDHIPFSLIGDPAKHPSYNRPQAYKGEPCQLFHNEGNGKFRNVSAQANILEFKGQPLQGKTLGVAICDYDNDGWQDIVVANDTERNYLFHNRHDGTFEEVGIEAGVAYNEQGIARGAMGIDAVDYANEGKESILIGNFTNEMIALYYNEKPGFFIDIAPTTELGPVSRLFLAFGCFFCDFDNDGWQDIFVANGHVEDDIQAVEKEVTYAQRPLLFHSHQGEFREVKPKPGDPLARPIVARGAAYGDYDNDGDLDVLVTTNNGPAYLLRNDSRPRHNALRLRLIGTRSNRNGIGARVFVKANGITQMRAVRSGSSYLSQSELPLTFGLGKAEEAEVEVQWLGGAREKLGKQKANQTLTVQEGKGVVAARPFTREMSRSP